MKKNKPIPVLNLFPSDCAVNLETLTKYLISPPLHAPIAYENGRPAEEIHCLSHLDRVEREVRLFVAGQTNNLSQFRAEVNSFLACFAHAAEDLVPLAVEGPGAYFVREGYYEAIPRLRVVEKHLKKRFRIKAGDYDKILVFPEEV